MNAEPRTGKAEPKIRTPYFGDYVLFEEVGRGGMGVVYDAQQATLDRRVALKLLSVPFAASEPGIQRLRLEAEAVARLDHPNIVPVYEVGEHEGQPYLAMKFVEGESLADRMARLNAPMEERQAAELMTKIARAVQHAHERGVLHRDLKPGNILIDSNGEPRLIDFGLAKCLEQDSGMTQTGAFLGTPAYTSPEQAVGHHRAVTTASDVYSLGAIFYSLLTGRPPFVGESPAEIIEKVRNSDPIPPHSLRSTLSADVETVCLKCLQKEPGHRYGTALAVAEDLERFLTGRPINARPVNWLERAWMWARRNRALAVLSLAATLALVAAVGGMLWGWRGAAARERLQSAIITMRAENPRAMEWSALAGQGFHAARLLRGKDYFRDQIAESLAGFDAVWVASRPVEGLQQLLFANGGKFLLLSGTSNALCFQVGRDSGMQGAQLSKPPGPLAGCVAEAPLQLIYFPAERLSVWHALEGRVVCGLEWPKELGPGQPHSAALWAASPNSQRLVGAISDRVGKAVLAGWLLPEGRLLRTIPLEAFPTALVLSPDGSLAASGDAAGGITIWELSTGTSIALLSMSRLPVDSVAFGPSLRANGKEQMPYRQVAAGDEGGSIGIWDLRDRRQIALCRGGHYQVSTLAFSPDGMTLASGGRGPVLLWDIATGTPLLGLTVKEGDGDNYGALSFTSDGKFLAASAYHRSLDGRAQIWRLQNGRGIRELRGLSSSITKLALSKDEGRLAAVGMDWSVGVWDIARNVLLRVFEVARGTTADNCAVAFSPDARLLAFSAGQEAQLWDIESGDLLRSWPLPPGLVDILAYPTTNELYLLRVETRQGTEMPDSRAPWQTHPRVCRLRNLLATGADRTIRVIEQFNVSVFVSAVSRDGRFFALEGLGGTNRARSILAIEAASGRTVWRVESTNTAAWARLAFSSAGVRLGYRANGWQLSNLGATNELRHLRNQPIAIGPDGHLWATLRYPQTPSLVLYHDETPLVSLGSQRFAIATPPQFDSRGRLLAWGNSDGIVSVCDLGEMSRQLARYGVALGLQQ